MKSRYLFVRQYSTLLTKSRYSSTVEVVGTVSLDRIYDHLICRSAACLIKASPEQATLFRLACPDDFVEFDGDENIIDTWDLCSKEDIAALRQQYPFVEFEQSLLV